MKKNKFKDSALIIIDVQNDFCSGGALAVPDGEAVIPVINAVSEQFAFTAATQDWHPEGHVSFASSHPGQSPYTTVNIGKAPQMLWPDHCVAGTSGADFHPELNTDSCNMLLRKGTALQMDSYSAFFENDRVTPTGLAGCLHNLNISSVVLCGLAIDYCVFYSAMDAVGLGLSVSILKDGVRGVGVPQGSVRRAVDELKRVGVSFV
ncbi:MAG: bifunctional nicotinamidase/pyrazinamidase [Spirochaetia bacterium]|nr:bifunctional nicotinamidase/pyrazinamidase [Spirochaetia bacterium]